MIHISVATLLHLMSSSDSVLQYTARPFGTWTKHVLGFRPSFVLPTRLISTGRIRLAEIAGGCTQWSALEQETSATP